MKYSIGLFLTVFIFSILNAQFDKNKLDEFFDVLEQNDKFNGSVALSQNGNIIYERAVGFADYDSKKKNNTNTKFRIGSISKTFTAVMIMMANEEGKLDLNEKIDKYFPTVKNSEKITISNLLNHRSGIFNFTSDPTYLTWNETHKSEEEMVKIISEYDSVFEPDSQADYSNSNYVLLSYILEKIYKKSYADILNEKIIRPLDLKNTFISNGLNISNNEAYSYNYTRDWKKQGETDMTIPLGAGAISSTPADIIRFGESLFEDKLISNESLEKMKTIKSGYGYGLFMVPFHEKKSLGHTGGIDGFSSMWSYFPDEKVSFAMTSNGSDFNNNDIAIAMLSSIFGMDYAIPEFKSGNEDVTPGYTGVFSNNQIGLEMTITEDNGNYFAQATGQMPFPLEKVSDYEFKFEPAGIVILFDEDLKALTLKQGGGEFVFLKK